MLLGDRGLRDNMEKSNRQEHRKEMETETQVYRVDTKIPA